MLPVGQSAGAVLGRCRLRSFFPVRWAAVRTAWDGEHRRDQKNRSAAFLKSPDLVAANALETATPASYRRASAGPRRWWPRSRCPPPPVLGPGGRPGPGRRPGNCDMMSRDTFWSCVPVGDSDACGCKGTVLAPAPEDHVLVLGAVELRVEPARGLHGLAPGHQRGDEGPVAPRQRRMPVGRSRLAVDLERLLAVPTTRRWRCRWPPPPRAGRGRPRHKTGGGVPVVVGVQERHQLATGVLEAEVAGTRDAPLGCPHEAYTRVGPVSSSRPRSGPPNRRPPR